jgi:hypothetical protein
VETVLRKHCDNLAGAVAVAAIVTLVRLKVYARGSFEYTAGSLENIFLETFHIHLEESDGFRPVIQESIQSFNTNLESTAVDDCIPVIRIEI